MLYVYKPVPGTRTINLVEVNGVDGLSESDLLFNLLIELRVANQIQLDQQSGIVTDSLAQLRSDVVNATRNPVI